MHEAVLVVKEAVPHWHAGKPSENLAQHGAEGKLGVIERALPMSLEDDQPGQPLPSKRTLAAPCVQRLSLFLPFTADGLAEWIEF